MRACSKTTCNEPAVATLTYDYSEATAVLGPLSPSREPGTMELCEMHANNFTAPRGWQVIRLATNFEPAPPSPHDLMALADLVRKVGNRPAPRKNPAPQPPSVKPESMRVKNRRANFRVVDGGVEDGDSSH